MQKVYERIGWENDPSTNTPINEDNLNKMDYALDEIDNRVLKYSKQYDAMVEATQDANTATSKANAATSKANTATANANAATKEAQSAAEEANNAVDAFKGALEGTVINDETPSEVTTYSSKRIELFDIQESTDTTLYNTKHGGYRVLEMLGNTEQKTLTGKNLLDCRGLKATTMNGITFTPVYDANELLQYLNVNGIETSGNEAFLNLFISEDSFPEGVKAGDTLYLGYGGISNCYVIAYAYYDGAWRLLKNTGSSSEVQIDIPSYATGLIVRARVVNGATVSNVKLYPMLSVEGGDYEPYCGGVPSPNPAYPQAMMSAGECVEMRQGLYNGSNGLYGSSTVTVCSQNKSPCTQGAVVEINTEKLATVAMRYFNGSTFVSTDGITNSYNHSFTVPSGVDSFYFNITLSDNSVITPDTVGKITLTINGKYVGCVKSTPNLVRSTEIGGIESTNGVDFVVTSIRKSALFSVEPNKKVYGYGYKENMRLFCYKADKSYIGSTLIAEGVEFVLPAQCYYARVHANIISLRNPSELILSYLPPSEYKETLAYFLTDEPIRDGDVVFKDSDGLWKCERNVAEVVFDGSDDEVWNRGTDTAFSRFILKLDDVMADSVCMCSQGIYGVNAGNSCAISSSKNFYIDVDVTAYPTVTEWKSHLQAKPMSLMYKLATPTIEVLDTDSQIALNSLETFDGVTYIEVDSRVQPLGIKGEYGTSQVGAYTLLTLNEKDIDKVERADMKAQLNELAVALVALGSEV